MQFKKNNFENFIKISIQINQLFTQNLVQAVRVHGINFESKNTIQ